jgi:hypothetical protein
VEVLLEVHVSCEFLNALSGPPQAMELHLCLRQIENKECLANPIAALSNRAQLAVEESQ